MPSPFRRDHYDVLIAGARCAGASTAMLLARMGLRVLVVDPAARGSDTLSTHALMRPAILQLHRWGLLDAVRSAGTPPATTTTFHYGDDPLTISIKPRDGVDALYAPRRTVLDAILADAAAAAGAEVVYGHSVGDVLRTPGGRIVGAVVTGRDRQPTNVGANLVVGADGRQSPIARLVGAEFDYVTPHAAATIYGYWTHLGLEGFHWYYAPGASAGAIPTNDDDTCVFVSIPPARFEQQRRAGLEALYLDVVREVSADLAERVASSEASGRLRGFRGTPGYLRRSVGPGWALVGDAGYFKDPLTAHGITDALRDAELLARAIARGTELALAEYQQTRNELVRGLLDVTDRISSFEWDLQSLKEHHLALSKEMAREADLISGLSPLPGANSERKPPEDSLSQAVA